MHRAQRIAVEIFAIVAFWILWDFRIAASLFILLCLFEAMRQDRPQDRGIPTLGDPAGDAPRRS